MLLRRLRISQFRNYEQAELEPAPGLTVVIGRNGQGKTNLVEAVAFLATLDSFRGATSEVLIRDGSDRGYVHADIDADGRPVDIRAELVRGGHNRVQLNGQRLIKARDLLGVVRVTVFTPDDLVLIKGGPGERRAFLDELLVALRPNWDSVRLDLERVLRQRATLLKQAGGRLDGESTVTLDVWDAKLAEVGTALTSARRTLVDELRPRVANAYQRLAEKGEAVVLTYESTWWDAGLTAALSRARNEDVKRGVNSVGPHRDDLRVELRGCSSRTHASQGEQRTLALSMRLAGHELVRERIGVSPVLLLDDVFSELDPPRTSALLRNLPEGQTLLTTAETIPPDAVPELVIEVRDGVIQ